jgi:hypothetical protein
MLPTIGLAFTNHPNIFDVCAELDRPTEQRKSLVVNLTTAGVHRASATIAAARVGVCARAPVPFAAAVRTSASAWRVPAVCMAEAAGLYLHSVRRAVRVDGDPRVLAIRKRDASQHFAQLQQSPKPR